MSNKKIALVTGGNRGLGLEVCRQLANKGHKVILTSRNKEKGLEALDKIGNENVVYHQLDINDQKSIRAVVDFVKSEFGGLDILVNNAGINYDTWQKALEANLDNVRETIETNLIGAWSMAMAFIPMMKEKDFGRVVNVSSGAGALNDMSGGTPAYAVSKSGMNVLTIKLASEVDHEKIKINSVCPGWVRTDMGGSEAPRSVEEGAKGIVWAATIPDDGPTGGFYRDGKKIDW